MNKVKFAVIAGLSVSLLCVVIFSSLFISAFDRTFYEEQFQKNGAYERFGSRAMDAADNLMGYLKGENELSDFFNKKEKTHMADVKRLFDAAYLVLWVAAVCAFALLILASRLWQGSFLKFLLLSMIATMGLAVFLSTIGFLITSDFGPFWTGFHEVLFSNDLWIMDAATDNIILLFPESFFRNMVLTIMIRSLAVTTILAGLALALFLLPKYYPGREE